MSAPETIYVNGPPGDGWTTDFPSDHEWVTYRRADLPPKGMVERWAVFSKHGMFDEYTTCESEAQAREIATGHNNEDRAVRILVPEQGDD